MKSVDFKRILGATFAGVVLFFAVVFLAETVDNFLSTHKFLSLVIAIIVMNLYGTARLKARLTALVCTTKNLKENLGNIIRDSVSKVPEEKETIEKRTSKTVKEPTLEEIAEAFSNEISETDKDSFDEETLFNEI